MGDPIIFFIFTHFFQAGRGHHQPTFKVSAKESHCLKERNFFNCFTNKGGGGGLHFIEHLGSTCMFYIPKYKYKF